MELEGGCYCGALRYSIKGEPRLRAQCHCRPCQYLSGGAPNYFMLVPPEGFAYQKGRPKQFTRDDLAHAVTREFCADCGTHIVNRRPGLRELVLKIGTLDNPEHFGIPQMAIFTEDMQPFHQLPEGVLAFEKLPAAT